EGAAQDLPEARHFAEGWKIGQPDAVYYMSHEPYKTAASGLIDYQYYMVDPGFTEDRWVSAMECRPGNRAVVHHIGVTLHKRGSSWGEVGRGVIIGWAPGRTPTRFPNGGAMKIPADTVFKFQMHYTANGQEEIDRSCVGFKFVDASTVRQEAVGGL